jgi:hypothetical protein
MKLRRVQRALRNFSAILASVPSAAYFLAYLLAVPAFACLYATFPGAFYSSTSHLEPSMATQLSRLAEELQAEVLNPTVGPPPRETRRSTESLDTLHLDSLVVHFNDATRDSIVGRVLATVTDANGRRFDWFGDAALRAPPRDDRFARAVRFPDPAARSLFIDLIWARYPEPEFSDRDQRAIEHRIFSRPYGGPGLVILRVPPALFEHFRKHMDAVGGLPSGFWETLPRMLYLSIVTITTLGFGDIVPLTARARAAVGTEVVIGVILVGLFLNSLARES